jgi:hypothetical protein
MGQQMQQNAVDFLLHSLEIYGALYLFYTALCSYAAVSCENVFFCLANFFSETKENKREFESTSNPMNLLTAINHGSFLQDSTNLYCFSRSILNLSLISFRAPPPLSERTLKLVILCLWTILTYKMWCCFQCIFNNKVSLVRLTSLTDTSLKYFFVFRLGRFILITFFSYATKWESLTVKIGE